MNTDTPVEDRLSRVEAILEQLATAHLETEQQVEQLAAIEARTEQRLEELAAAQQRTEQQLSELQGTVRELAAAQQRTEQRLEELATSQRELAVAQQRTEQRLEELAAAQARTEERVGGLEVAVARLAEAQARTEERVGGLEVAVARLAEAQARTEERVGELEAAIQQTNQSIQQLARQVGGLSETVGGDIEDIAYIVVHDVLKREFGWKVGVLERSWQRWNGRVEEIDLFGQATDPERPYRHVWIVGEAKHNLTVREVERFASQVRRARQHLLGELFPVCFCYRARPEVQESVRKAGLYLIFSYGKLVRPDGSTAQPPEPAGS